MDLNGQLIDSATKIGITIGSIGTNIGIVLWKLGIYLGLQYNRLE